LAVRELEGSDWVRVLRREALSGIVLGSILGLIGFLRIVLPLSTPVLAVTSFLVFLGGWTESKRSASAATSWARATRWRRWRRSTPPSLPRC
jgi:hypothetical protein